MKTYTVRCPSCDDVYLEFNITEDSMAATYYTGLQLLTSDGNGNATKHKRRRQETTVDILTGGDVWVSTECRCEVRQVRLDKELEAAYLR